MYPHLPRDRYTAYLLPGRGVEDATPGVGFWTVQEVGVIEIRTVHRDSDKSLAAVLDFQPRRPNVYSSRRCLEDD